MANSITLFIFFAILGMTWCLYWFLVLRPENSEERALRGRLKGKRKAVLAPMAKGERLLSGFGPLNTLLGHLQFVKPIEERIRLAGMSVTVGTLVLTSALLALVGTLVVYQFLGSLVAALVLGFLCGYIPFGFLTFRADARVRKFEEQFPEAMDLMARALRAGHALTTSLQMVGEEVPDPVGLEFRELYEQQNFGMSLPDALRAFAIRVPVIDARFFVTALLTQRETGGNLSEVLDNLASVIRERFKVKRQVRVMSAHGRITGWALGLMPPVLAVVLFVSAPQHMRLLITDPLGIYMVSAAIVLQIIGVLAIRKIVDVEY